MKRILCILLGLSLLLGMAASAYAEEGGEDDVSFTDEQLAEMEEEEEEAEADVAAVITGEVYHEKTREDFNMNSPALYTAKMRTDFGGTIYQTDGSHGCVNLPYSAAEELYSIIDWDDVVIVHW